MTQSTSGIMLGPQPTTDEVLDCSVDSQGIVFEPIAACVHLLYVDAMSTGKPQDSEVRPQPSAVTGDANSTGDHL